MIVKTLLFYVFFLTLLVAAAFGATGQQQNGPANPKPAGIAQTGQKPGETWGAHWEAHG